MLILYKKIEKDVRKCDAGTERQDKNSMQIEEKEYDQSFDWRIWKKLFPFMKPFRKYMIIALVFNTLCALVDIALPLFQQYAINHFISGNTTEGIGSFAGTYLVTIIFQTVSVVNFLPLCYGD